MDYTWDFRVLNIYPKLRKIVFRFRPNITSETIDKLIEMANNRPKETISFECFGSESELKLYYIQNKPKNLNINIVLTSYESSDSEYPSDTEYDNQSSDSVSDDYYFNL